MGPESPVGSRGPEAGKVQGAGLEAGQGHAAEEHCAETLHWYTYQKATAKQWELIVDFQAEKVRVGRDHRGHLGSCRGSDLPLQRAG